MQLTIEKYTQLVAPLDVRDLDLANAFHTQRLDADVLRCLRYMHDIELHTVCYLRDLLVTSAHRDPEITTFLTFWSFEEYWHGEAIAAVLACSRRDGRARRGCRQLRRARRVAEATASRSTHGLASMVVGPSMTAVHMTWGAINEWTTQAGYARLAQRCEASRAGRDAAPDHEARGPAHRLLRGAGCEAAGRQSSRPVAHPSRRSTRFWAPVGSDVMPEPEVRSPDLVPLRRRGRQRNGRAHRSTDRQPSWTQRTRVGR